MAISARVGRRIADARAAARITQAELGARLQPPRSHAAVSDIERGKTTLGVELLSTIAGILRVPLAALYEDRPPTGEGDSCCFACGAAPVRDGDRFCSDHCGHAWATRVLQLFGG
jgi:transcriptional regulator with XRE-family HTH domain